MTVTIFVRQSDECVEIDVFIAWLCVGNKK